MPFIRVTYPTGAMTQAQKDALAPLLVDAVMRQEVEPVTAEARWVTGSRPITRCSRATGTSPGSPRRIIRSGWSRASSPPASSTRRGAMRRRSRSARPSPPCSTTAATSALNNELVSPAMLMRVYSVFVEVPEGSWGVAGRTISALEISDFIGNPEGSARDRELKANVARVRLARAS